MDTQTDRQTDRHTYTMHTKQSENSYCQMVAPTLLNVTGALVAH